LRHNQKLLTDL